MRICKGFYVIIAVIIAMGISLTSIPEAWSETGLSSWMEDIYTDNGDVRLNEIVIPGTHDSGTYGISSSSDFAPGADEWYYDLASGVVADWAITQNRDIYTQLNEGIRYLDLRVAYHDDEFVIVHTMVSVGLQSVLDQVKQFSDEHPYEVIILDFQELPGSSHYTEFAGMVKNTLSGKLLNDSHNAATVTFNQIWAAGTPLIALMDSSTLAGGHSEFWHRDSQFDSCWPNENDRSDVYDDLVDCLDSQALNKFHVSQVIYTPTTGDIIEGIAGGWLGVSDTLEELNESLESAPGNWIHEWTNDGRKVNIVLCDFYESSDVVTSAITANMDVLPYMIIMNQGKCLDVESQSTSNGANIHLWGCHGDDSQLWFMDSNGIIHSKMNYFKVIDVSGGNTGNGTNIQLWEYNASNAQKWTLDGSYLRSALDWNKVIDVNGGNTDNGTNIHLWEYNGSPAQRWFMGGASVADSLCPDAVMNAYSYSGDDKIFIDCSIESDNTYGSTPAATTELVVWSYNIARGSKYPQIVDEIQNLPENDQPDVLLLSEVDRNCERSGGENIAREMAASLGMYYTYGVEFYEADQYCEHGNAILSRYPISNPEVMRYSSNSDYYLIGGGEGDNRVGGRMAIHADIQIGESAAHVYSTHLAARWDDESYREAQAVQLREHGKQFAGPVIVGGDMNSHYYKVGEWLDKVIDNFTDHGYNDAHDNYSGNRDTLVDGGEFGLIDFIFARNTVSGNPVIGGSVFSAMSDHYPLWATIEIPDPNADQFFYNYGSPKMKMTGNWGPLLNAPDAVVNWDNGHTYMFAGDIYYKYNNDSGELLTGYPKRIDGHWDSLWSSNIDCALDWGNGKAYFFKGSEYMRYDMDDDEVDSGYPRGISDGWPGMNGYWSSDLDAAINWGNGKVYFFKGDQYIRYDISDDSMDSGYPQPINGNWGYIDGPVSSASKGLLSNEYFFVDGSL